MLIIKNIVDLRAYLAKKRNNGSKVGLVPTMGALHEGHMTLVRAAKATCNCVVVSIFVNPKQFGPREDFDAYPRDLAKDCQLLKDENVDCVFAPSAAEMWPAGNETYVDTASLSKILMGRLRPGHFRGVTTVVAKLFNIVQPELAFFGEKDFQQVAIIRRMVADLAFPVRIISVPILREKDGVAASSRNALLSIQQRAAAVILPQSLEAARAAFESGERSVSNIIKLIRAVLKREPLAKIDAIDIRDSTNLEVVRGKIDRPVVILLTVTIGTVRLIDQCQFYEENE